MDGFMTNTYGDIPDNARAKPYYPMCEHVWRFYKKVGWEYLDYSLEKFPDIMYDLFKHRLDETIATAKDVIDGKIKNPEQTIAYMLFPPSVTIRTDLQQGVLKLLYGDSCDASFVMLHDMNGEIYSLLNAHIENGIPVDWFLVNPNDEVLKRKHLKLGYQLKDIPVKIKDMSKISRNIVNILKDIRNERMPQWADSIYHCVSVIGCAATNALLCTTNYETWTSLWDGMSSKSYYKRPDSLWKFFPSPPMLSTMSYLGRSDFALKMVGLTHRNNLNILGIEGDIFAYFDRELPEVTEYIRETYEKMIHLPRSTLEAQPPNLKDKDVMKNERFDWNYPDERIVKPEDLEFSIDEMMDGVYLNIDHEFPNDEKVDKSKIISTGLGRNTKFF